MVYLTTIYQLCNLASNKKNEKNYYVHFNKKLHQFQILLSEFVGVIWDTQGNLRVVEIRTRYLQKTTY